MRLPVEGFDEIEVVRQFPNGELTQDIQPTTPEGVVRCPAANPASDGHPQDLYWNASAALQTWRHFFVGTGVPGGSQEIGAPDAPTGPFSLVALTAGQAEETTLLLPGQRIDSVMAGNPVGTAPTFSQGYIDSLIQDLKVNGSVWGNQIDVVSDVAPSTLLGPTDELVKQRQVLFGAPSTYLINRDTDGKGGNTTKTVRLILKRPSLPDVELWGGILNSNAKTPTKGTLPTTFFLQPGESLQYTIAEATIEDDSLVFWLFRDLL